MAARWLVIVMIGCINIMGRDCYKEVPAPLLYLECYKGNTSVSCTREQEPLVNYLLGIERITFTWKPLVIVSPVYYYKVTRTFHACGETVSTIWVQGARATISLSTVPYSTVQLHLSFNYDTGTIERRTYVVDIPQQVPGNMVQSITCFETSFKDCTVKVERNCYLDHGPDLHVQSFLQLKSRQQSHGPFITSQINETGYGSILLPTDLLPNREYRLTTHPANKAGYNFNVGRYLDFTTRPAEKPSPPQNLRASVTRMLVLVAWDPPSAAAGSMKYLVSGRPVYGSHPDHTLTYTWNTSTQDTQTQFTDVGAGVEVEVSVSACNSVQCSDWTVERFWTKPEPPQVTSELQWVTATDNTITISLPTVSSFPVYQWVVVTRYEENTHGVRKQRHLLREQEQKQDAEQEQKKNAEQEQKQIARQLVMKQGNNKQNNSTMWIAAKLSRNDRKVREVFVVGDNDTYAGFHNTPLIPGATYWLTVVTETTAGPHRELTVSKPLSCVTSHPTSIWGMVAGTVGVILVVLVVCVACIVLRRRSRKKPSTLELRLPSTIRYHKGLLTSEVSQAVLDLPLQEVILPEEVVRDYISEQEEVAFPEQDQQAYSGVLEEAVYANLSRKIPRAEVEAYLSMAIHSPDLELEFRSVPAMMGKSCSEGKLEANRCKNRYKNNIPYDDTRVKLPSQPTDPYSDYINASYIQGHSRANAFIASQGPKDFNVDTISDFWRMIWHTRSPIIIMVTNLIENGKVKVAQYWPEKGHSMVKDGIEIKLVSTEDKMDFIIRTLEVSRKTQVREVKQYHYTAWPDHGVPNNPYGLAQMIKHLPEVPTSGPLTVHCSAGIGRSGTVLLVLLMMDQLSTSGYLDPHQALVMLRNGRPRLVENKAQYIFGHQLLQEVLSGVKTSYTCGEFPGVVEDLRLPHPPSNTSIILQQFQYLKSLPKVMSFKFGKDPTCAHLNRNLDILPADNKMVFLQNLGGGLASQYVNVVRVNGINRKDAYLAGEHPLPHTVENLWRLVYERRVPVWVLLHTLPQHHVDYPDVYSRDLQLTVGNMVITVIGQHDFDNFTEYDVEVTASHSRVAEAHKCKLLVVKGWPHEDLLPASPDPLLAVIDMAESIGNMQSYTLFTCKDGVTGCGVMMALLQLVARMKLVQEVDVYRSVLSVIYDRPQFITRVEQYDFLHTAAISYLGGLNNYANFN